METPEESGTPSAPVTRSMRDRGRDPKARRSSITNGSRLLPTASGCSVWARIMNDTLGALMAHLGGADMVSETQKLASRRVSFLEAELIYLENEIATIRQEGGEPDPNKLDLYGRLADRQRRLSDPLGWRRTPRDLGPSLGDLMRQQTIIDQNVRTFGSEEQS